MTLKESEYTKGVLKAFTKSFPQGWIDNLKWDSSNQKASFSKGIELIQKFELCIFVNYSKLVLSADYFINLTNYVNNLDSIIVLEDVIPEDNDYKTKLQERFVGLCQDIQGYNLMLKYHISVTENRLKPNSKKTIINALTDRFDGLLLVFKLICDSCWADFVFSYNEEYIRQLIFYCEHLKYLYEKQSKEVKEVIDATIEKLTIMLGKLSVFTENKELAYRFDLHEYRIALTSPSQFDKDDFRSHLLKYIDVNQISQEDINEWQHDIHQKPLALWKFIFLMRYYVKKTKSRQQIDNLLKEFDRHNEEIIGITYNLVDIYAYSLAKNYMYNSRFSFLCKYDSDYTFERMKCDLEEIEAIQNDTLIFNYHPYQKAIEFLMDRLSIIVSKSRKIEKAEQYLDYLNRCFDKFKNNVGWCKDYQPYYIQSCYKFSTIKLGPSKNFDVFCPSSFCRPLKFKDIDEKVVQFNNELSFLNYQVKHLPDRVEWQEAKDKVERMERKNLETMGLFVTITTFLVGVLTIFIGNNDVSIFTKLEYTSVLGMVLMLFVCLGYFVVSDKIKQWKSLFFGVFALLLLIAISIAYCKALFGA